MFSEEKRKAPVPRGTALGVPLRRRWRGSQLFLPGSLLVAIGAKLFAPFVLIDFCFASFF
jgi:hypothetical protein